MQMRKEPRCLEAAVLSLPMARHPPSWISSLAKFILESHHLQKPAMESPYYGKSWAPGVWGRVELPCWGHSGVCDNMTSPSLPLSCSNGMAGTRPSWSPAWSTTGASRRQSVWRTLPSGVWASTAVWSALTVALVCPTTLSWLWKVSATTRASSQVVDFTGIPWPHPCMVGGVKTPPLSHLVFLHPFRRLKHNFQFFPSTHIKKNRGSYCEIMQYYIVIQSWVLQVGSVYESLWDI